MAGRRLSRPGYRGTAPRDQQRISRHGMQSLQVIGVKADQAASHVLQKCLGHPQLRSVRLRLIHSVALFLFSKLLSQILYRCLNARLRAM